MTRLSTVLVLCLALAACAVGNTFDYRNAVPTLAVAPGKPVAVTALDQRPYVRAGDNTPQWVGMFRGGFGNPWGVHTTSGAPLADDVALAVAAALKAKGVDTVVGGERLGNAQRKVTVVLRDWRSDTMYNTLIRYDLTVEVTDAAGTRMAANALKGERTFSSFNNLPSTTGNEVLAVFKEVMAQLLDAPEIRNALL